MPSELESGSDPTGIDARAKAWEEGYKAGLVKSLSPAVLDIARSLAAAAEASAHATRLLAEAVGLLMQSAGIAEGEKLPTGFDIGVFKKAPSLFSKPPSIFKKSPSTHSTEAPQTGSAPWLGTS